MSEFQGDSRPENEASLLHQAFLPVVQTRAPMCFLRKCCYVLRRVRDITDKTSGGVHKTMLKWMPCSGPMPAILATESLVGFGGAPNAILQKKISLVPT